MLYMIKDGKYYGDASAIESADFIAQERALGYECATFDDAPDFHIQWVNTPAADATDEQGRIFVTLTLAQLKTFKKAQLEDATEGFDARRKDPGMTFRSSLGFTVDGDARSRDNIEGLINIGASPVSFKDHDNQLHSLSLDDLKTLLKEAQKNGALLYQQKWALQAEIDACKSAKKLAAIEIKFTMADFTEAANANQTASA